MTKIKDYTQDSSINDADKLLGTDSTDNSTKTFSVGSLIGYVNTEPTSISAKSGSSVTIPAGTSRVVLLTESTGDITISLHDATDLNGSIYSFIAVNGNSIVIDPDGSATIDGLSTKTVSLGTIVAYDGNWYTL
jgi:ABC-type Fe3+-hydroxamate transport system substrate-binding protein